MLSLSTVLCRSMAESYAPSDWKGALTGRQFERSGMQAYGAAKLFNIMLAKEYSKRLKVCQRSIGIRHVHLFLICATVYVVTSRM